MLLICKYIRVILILEVSKIVNNVSMKPVMKNGKSYLHIESCIWKIIPTKFNIKLENLFNGDKVLGMIIL